jgi:hypothetical protein
MDTVIKMKIEIDRAKMINKFKMYGLARKIQFERVCNGLELYDLFMDELIKSSKFDTKLKSEFNKFENDSLFFPILKYPKSIKPSVNELGFNFKTGYRILVKNKKGTTMRMCRKHNIEYPLGSKCPECSND